jgi:uncharacterized coiled-coil DUF342 family protein
LNTNFHVLGDEGNREIEEYKKLNIQLRQQIANLEAVNQEHVESMTEMMRGRDEIGWGEKLKQTNNQLCEQIVNLENINQQLIEGVKKTTREIKNWSKGFTNPSSQLKKLAWKKRRSKLMR